MAALLLLVTVSLLQLTGLVLANFEVVIRVDGVEQVSRPSAPCRYNFSFCVLIDSRYCVNGREVLTAKCNENSFTHLNGEHPVVFNIAKTWTGILELDIEVRRNGETIGDFDVTEMIPLGSDVFYPETYTDKFMRVNLKLSLKVFCTKGFFGPSCSSVCEVRDDEQGHFTCDTDGKRKCLTGYQNPSTNCTEAITLPCPSPCETNLPRPCNGSECPCEGGTECGKPGSNTALIGALTSAFVLLIVVVVLCVFLVVLVLVLKSRRQRQVNTSSVVKDSDLKSSMPGDNPMYSEIASVRTPSLPPPPYQLDIHDRNYAVLSPTSFDIDFKNPLYTQQQQQQQQQPSNYEIPVPLH